LGLTRNFYLFPRNSSKAKEKNKNISMNLSILERFREPCEIETRSFQDNLILKLKCGKRQIFHFLKYLIDFESHYDPFLFNRNIYDTLSFIQLSFLKDASL